MPQVVYRFGSFSVETSAHALLKNGVRLSVQEQPFQVLLTLLENPGQVVTREALRMRLWGTDTFVDFDQSLNSAVRRLRIALEDNSRDPVFVETIPRVGFRFLPPVAVETVSAPETVSTPLNVGHGAPAVADEPVVPLTVPAARTARAAVAAPTALPGMRRFASRPSITGMLVLALGLLLGAGTATWRTHTDAANANARGHGPEAGLSGRSANQLFSTVSFSRETGSALPAVAEGAGSAELEGWYHLRQRSQADFVLAHQAFTAALSRQPESASARVGMAETEILLALNGDAPESRLAHARAEGRRALELAPHLASAHSVIGATDALIDWNAAAAEEEFQTAIRLDANDSLAHMWYAIFVLLPRRQLRDAEREMRVAVRQDPLSLIAHTDFGWILEEEGKQEAALEQFRFVLNLNPGFVPARFHLQQMQIRDGQHNEAVRQALVAYTPRITEAAATGVDPAELDKNPACEMASQHGATPAVLRAAAVQRCPTAYFAAHEPEMARLEQRSPLLTLLGKAHLARTAR